MERKNVASGAPWEPIVGYSRAVRVGPFVVVAGTTATDSRGGIVARGDAYGQAVHIFRKIEAALEEAGARLPDVVRTPMFLADIGHSGKVGRAPAQASRASRPGATLVRRGRVDHPDDLLRID